MSHQSTKKTLTFGAKKIMSEQEWFIRNQISDLKRFVKAHEITSYKLFFSAYPARSAVECAKAQLKGSLSGLELMLSKA
jgi:hypothetical protein